MLLRWPVGRTQVARALPPDRLYFPTAFMGAVALTLWPSIAKLVDRRVPALAAFYSFQFAAVAMSAMWLIYTALLKAPALTQNIVIGGASPVRFRPGGEACAASGLWVLGVGGCCLVMLWTPAHFWGLACCLRRIPLGGHSMLTGESRVPPPPPGDRPHYDRAHGLTVASGWLALPTGGPALRAACCCHSNSRLAARCHAPWPQAPEDPMGAAKGCFRLVESLPVFGICLFCCLMARLPGKQRVQPAELGTAGAAYPFLPAAAGAFPPPPLEAPGLALSLVVLLLSKN